MKNREVKLGETVFTTFDDRVYKVVIPRTAKDNILIEDVDTKLTKIVKPDELKAVIPKVAEDRFKPFDQVTLLNHDISKIFIVKRYNKMESKVEVCIKGNSASPFGLSERYVKKFERVV